MCSLADCTLEQVVKYGETYHIPLSDILGPITLEFRSSQAQANQTTEPPAVVLLNQTSIPAEEYKGRLSVSEKRVTLSMVQGTDEGSFTVLDRDGKVRRRSCLNVKGEMRKTTVREGVVNVRDGREIILDPGVLKLWLVVWPKYG